LIDLSIRHQPANQKCRATRPQHLLSTRTKWNNQSVHVDFSCYRQIKQ